VPPQASGHHLHTDLLVIAIITCIMGAIWMDYSEEEDSLV